MVEEVLIPKIELSCQRSDVLVLWDGNAIGLQKLEASQGSDVHAVPIWLVAAALWVVMNSQLIPLTVILSQWQTAALCCSRRCSCFYWALAGLFFSSRGSCAGCWDGQYCREREESCQPARSTPWSLLGRECFLRDVARGKPSSLLNLLTAPK